MANLSDGETDVPVKIIFDFRRDDLNNGGQVREHKYFCQLMNVKPQWRAP